MFRPQNILPVCLGPSELKKTKYYTVTAKLHVYYFDEHAGGL